MIVKLRRDTDIEGLWSYFYIPFDEVGLESEITLRHLEYIRNALMDMGVKKEEINSSDVDIFELAREKYGITIVVNW